MIIKHTALVLTMIVTWIGIALATMLTGSIATAAVPVSTKLPDNIAIIGRTNHLLIVRSTDPNYVKSLYQSGAIFVLPARQKTCLALQVGR